MVLKYNINNVIYELLELVQHHFVPFWSYSTLLLDSFDVSHGMIFNSSKKSIDMSNSLGRMTPQGTCGRSSSIFSPLGLGNTETYRTVQEEWRCQRPAQKEEMSMTLSMS